MAAGRRRRREARHEPGRLGRLVAVVRGYVQGVGFRWFVQREAARLGLEGWVANQADGSVEVVAEGPEDVLGQLVLVLWEGPAGSSVERRRRPP